MTAGPPQWQECPACAREVRGNLAAHRNGPCPRRVYVKGPNRGRTVAEVQAERRALADPPAVTPPGWRRPPTWEGFARRVLRALELQVVRVGPGRFHVTGGEEEHYVDLQEGTCDCDDRDGDRLDLCKHRVAARMFVSGLLAVWRVAAEQLPPPKRRV